nr:aminoacyl--tRNA ligase-related protein [Verrucomicrobium spinosum]
MAYLRPETAQAIFAQFRNVVDSSRVKVPFGICQIGKAFRNEVTPKNFTFRSREFEQMELEFFIKPDEAVEILAGSVVTWSEGADLSTPQPNWGWDMWHRYWVSQRVEYYNSIGLGTDVLDYYWQGPDDLATTPVRAWTSSSSSRLERKSWKGLPLVVISTSASTRSTAASRRNSSTTSSRWPPPSSRTSRRKHSSRSASRSRPPRPRAPLSRS